MESVKRTLQIGGIEVEAWYSSEPPDGYMYSIDIAPQSEEKLYKKFHLMRLRNVSPTELPESCSIVFQSPRSEFKRVDFVKINKKQGRCELEIILCIDFRDWEMKESVPSFVDRYCDALKNRLPGAPRPTRLETLPLR
ncbi:hypothetical protein GCM10007418_24530 [Halopseudomonas salina]|uniref:Uncharacterized protein n=1 Tax=Halopseudomonas salina TaxID=1323744 RepID=A0ABQ1PUU8_9GAMM|nr:hypothetical protein GCM10007418_24530 [Halopseudomonas salina]